MKVRGFRNDGGDGDKDQHDKENSGEDTTEVSHLIGQCPPLKGRPRVILGVLQNEPPQPSTQARSSTLRG